MVKSEQERAGINAADRRSLGVIHQPLSASFGLDYAKPVRRDHHIDHGATTINATLGSMAQGLNGTYRQLGRERPACL
jgi:hypothetical protein